MKINDKFLLSENFITTAIIYVEFFSIFNANLSYKAFTTDFKKVLDRIK
jgi:hypothetical protein